MTGAGPARGPWPQRLIFPLLLGLAVLCGSLAARHGPASGAAGYALSWAWGLVLVAAMIGWGRGVNRLLLPARHLGWGLRAALGLAVTVVLGGVLNLAGVISPLLLLLFISAGAALLLLDAERGPGAGQRALRRLAEDPVLLVLAVVVAALALVQYSSSVAGTIDTVYTRPAFDVHDDLQAYLAFPEQMLETGSLGRQPFEARRVLSLGGQSFLDALVLAARPLQALHLVDQGIAMLVLLGLVLGAGKRLRLGPRLTALLLLLALAFPHLQMRGNTSAVLTGVVFLLAWFLFELDERESGRPAAVALLIAAACTVKSTFIAFAVPFFLLLVLAGLLDRGGRRRALREAAVIAVLVIAFTLPWMLSAYVSSGTLLYPVLGRGFLSAASNHGFPAVQGSFGVPAVEVVRMIWRRLLPLLPMLLLLVFVADHRPRRPVAALAAAAFIAVVLLVLLGDPSLNHSLKRYVFPLFVTSFLGVALAAGENAAGDEKRRLGAAAAAVFAVVAAFLFITQGSIRDMYDQMIANAAHGLEGKRLVAAADLQAVASLQAALPPGATVLATLRRPFLLDFARNRVDIMSLPGFSSPPPGLPIDDGAEAVARYLLDHHVRYLAYGGMRDVHDLLALTEDHIRARYPRSKMRWAMLTYHRLYRQVVLDLAATRRVLYGDDRRVLLDLQRRQPTVIPAQVEKRSGFFADFNWTNGDGVLAGLRLPVPAAGSILAVDLYPVHPRGGDPAALEVHVLVNGAELTPAGAARDTIRFHLPEDLREIHRIEIRSATFVPRDEGLGNDTRTLGLPVKDILILPPGA